MVGNQGQVMGVDMANKLMALAQKKAAQKNLSNISFQWGDMTNLELKAESFDAVVCVFAIFFVPEMEEQIRKLWQLVRPGGKLAITTWGANILAPIYGIWGCVANKFAGSPYKLTELLQLTAFRDRSSN